MGVGAAGGVFVAAVPSEVSIAKLSGNVGGFQRDDNIIRRLWVDATGI